MRAVLLIGADERNRPRQELPETICVAEYAPYSALFGQASMVVHQGGVGTTAQCLRAGKPMLIMPYSHDQPDNGRRVRRLKVGRVIQRKNYTPVRVEKRLRAMLEEPQFARRAAQVAQMLGNEDGVGAACDALEELYAGSREEAPGI
jgi:UDP:flavonoid glycosyltransferase YjiC (YdhE family)